MSRPSPVHGTPIHGLDDIASMAMRADAAAGKALSPNLGGGFGGNHGSDGNPTIDLPFLYNRQTFKICSCWRREEKNVYGGDMLGCYWVCDAVPVNHYRNWKWSGTGAIPPPETFWTPEQLAKNDLKTRIWWPISEKPCCDTNESSSASSISNSAAFDDSSQPSSEKCGCDDTHEWEAANYPKFSEGQWVECFYDYDAGEWRLIDAFDGTIRFQLDEPLIGCSWANATVIGFECEPCESSVTSSSGSSRSISSISVSSSSNPPSSSIPSSSSISSSSECCTGRCVDDPLIPQPDIHACPGDTVRQYLVFEDPDNRCAPIEWRGFRHPQGSHITPNGPKDAVWVWAIPTTELENNTFNVIIEARDKCGCISRISFNVHIDECDSNSSKTPPEHTTCRVVKDVKFNNVTCELTVEYCTIYLMGGSYCTCEESSAPSSASSQSSASWATSETGSSFSAMSSSPSSSIPSSSSNPSSSSIPSSSSSVPSSSPSSSCDDCLCDSVRKCQVRIYDPIGIANVQFRNGIVPAQFTGWAKWRADSRRFEVVSPYGYPRVYGNTNGVSVDQPSSSPADEWDTLL